MKTQEIRAIIAEAKARDAERLEELVRSRMPAAGEADVREAVRFALDYIEAVPFLMEQVAQAAEARGTSFLVEPLLAHAERYFIEPRDHLPEQELGLIGLIDDAYLTLSLIQCILETPDPLLKLDLEPPNAFARALLGPDFTAMLDEEAQQARRQTILGVFQTLTELGEQAPASGEAPSIPTDRLDRRFIGRWSHSTYLSNGSLSASSHRYRVYGPDGRFIEFSQSFADATQVDASGGWAEWSTLRSGLRPAHRGQWEVSDSTLTLHWDNESHAEYGFDLRDGNLVLMPTGDEHQLWQRA